MKYTYRCLACENRFDVELKLHHVINSAKFPKKECPKCNGISVKTQGKVSIHFKGAGFYSTDNKKETK